jgi:hypothetical protein
MIQFKFTVKIKDEHNPPTFKEELGKGVIHTRVVTFTTATEEDLGTPNFTLALLETANDLRYDWVEVNFEKI